MVATRNEAEKTIARKKKKPQETSYKYTLVYNDDDYKDLKLHGKDVPRKALLATTVSVE